MRHKAITGTAIRSLPTREELPEDHGIKTRRCSECNEWLSRWNKGPNCYRHGTQRVIIRADDPEGLEYLRELMEED